MPIINFDTTSTVKLRHTLSKSKPILYCLSCNLRISKFSLILKTLTTKISSQSISNTLKSISIAKSFLSWSFHLGKLRSGCLR